MDIIFWALVYLVGYAVTFVIVYRVMEMPYNRHLSGGEKIFNYTFVCGFWPIVISIFVAFIFTRRFLRRHSF